VNTKDGIKEVGLQQISLYIYCWNHCKNESYRRSSHSRAFQ